MKKRNLIASLLAGASAFAGIQPAFAQQVPQADAASNPSDADAIVVTARRREETLISVPVVVTAVSGANLQQRGVTNLDGLARIVPQLLIAPQGGSVQGGNISIRGIAGPDSNPFGDQAVSFTIDGVQIAKATVRRMSDFDVAQIEVLKGPQALYFGKNSMAGIINITTADPGDHFEMGAKLGYEFNAREMRGEGYVSTPLGGGLGVRIAGQYSTMQGYLTDQTPLNSGYFNSSHAPKNTNFGIRGTLKYDDGGPFDAKLKVSYGRVDQNGPAAATEFVNCPFGARQFSFIGPAPIGDNSQCTAGDKVVNAGYGKVVSTIPGTLNFFRPDGRNFSPQKQVLGGLVMHFHPSDKLTFTSATGYYKVDLDQCQNYENSFAVLLPSCNTYHNREFSQELNFNTDLGGPVDFTGGLYFADTKAVTGSLTYLFGGQFDLLAPGFGGPTSPAIVNNYLFTQKGQAYSAFISGSFKPIPTLEIAGGVRYSYEKKRLTDVRDGGGITEPGGPYTTILDASTVLTTTPNAMGNFLLKTKDHWDDFSPEATITYRPTGDFTAFASYKHGFLSGGFNGSSVNLALKNLDLSYKPQTIQGFEAGIKTRLMDGAVLFNAAAYSYKIKDLQVVNFVNATSTIRNAASSKIYGAEADISWHTPLRGLTLNAATAYNHAQYESFPAAPCYNGQSPAMGCTIVGGNPIQNLASRAVPRSPRWNTSGGFNYESALGNDLKIGLTGDAQYSGSYLTDAQDAPTGRQPSYTLLNASARIGAENDRWTVSVIGRNLSNKYYYVASTDVPFTGGGQGVAGQLPGDRFASVARGREVLVQVGFKFGN
ncbi:TonB-dependent receptor [Novosphingobium lentum]|uniref:TonB-dependent receptor n=1 Tax=Novosphingobium lentum TaxID=145287 RepID=UPI0008325DED|nr:TonB-dependent receptor [Novosphingobium lentum]